MTDDISREIESELLDPEYRAEYGRETAKLEFALALIRARKAQGLTQTEVAANLGVKQPYVARLESGDANPTIGKAGSILAMLWRKASWSLNPLVNVSTADEDRTNPIISTGQMTGEELEDLMGRLATVSDDGDKMWLRYGSGVEPFSGPEKDFASAA